MIGGREARLLPDWLKSLLTFYLLIERLVGPSNWIGHLSFQRFGKHGEREEPEGERGGEGGRAARMAGDSAGAVQSRNLKASLETAGHTGGGSPQRNVGTAANHRPPFTGPSLSKVGFDWLLGVTSGSEHLNQQHPITVHFTGLI